MQNKTVPERLYTVSEILRLLNIPRHKLVYLFDCRRLRAEDFQTMPNGHRVFCESDFEKVKAALFEVSQK